MKFRFLLQSAACAAVALLAACGGSRASAPAPAGLQVSEGWVRATPPMAQVAAGYLQLHNPGKQTLRVTGLQSPHAGRVESHDMTVENGQMRMRAAELVIAPGESLSLQPGGRHLMFLELGQPFAAGQSVPLTILTDDGRAQTVELPVRDAAPEGAASGHDHHGH